MAAAYGFLMNVPWNLIACLWTCITLFWIFEDVYFFDGMKVLMLIYDLCIYIYACMIEYIRKQQNKKRHR